METPGKAKQRHIEGKTAEETEAVHVPADESEQINRLLENLLKQFHGSGNFRKMTVLWENSCLGYAIEFVGATKQNLSMRESGCMSEYMTVVNYITHGLKHSHSHCKVERLTWYCVHSKALSFLAFFSVSLRVYNYHVKRLPEWFLIGWPLKCLVDRGVSSDFLTLFILPYAAQLSFMLTLYSKK